MEDDRAEVERPRSEREKVLLEGVKLTAGDRNRTYGDPSVNLNCQFALYETLQRFKKADRGAAHDAALMHVCAKLARIVTGPGELHRDNYVDAATYMAIAFECAEKEKPIPAGFMPAREFIDRVQKEIADD